MAGISISDMGSLDLNEINVISDGVMDRREMQGNDMFAGIYQGAILNSLAVWGSKDFPKRQPKFRIRPMSDEEEAQEALRAIMQTGLALTAEMERADSDSNRDKAKELYNKFVSENNKGVK